MKIIGASDEIVIGKISLGDIALLSMYMLYSDKEVDLEQVFTSDAPSAMKIVKKLLDNKKIYDLFQEQRAAYPYFPL